MSSQAATVAGCFGGGGAVVDDPHLCKGRNTQHDLIEFGVVIDAIDMHPVGRSSGSKVIDVNLFGVISDDSVVCKCRVHVLNQVIPRMPLPDDGSTAVARRLDLDDVIGPQLVVGEQPRITPRSRRFCDTFQFPGHEQQIAVGKWLHIMMMLNLCTGVFEVPQQGSIPGDPLHSTTGSTRRDRRITRDSSGSEDVTPLEQVGGLTGIVIAGPTVNDATDPIDEICGGVTAGSKEAVAAVGGRGTMKPTDRLVSLFSR